MKIALFFGSFNPIHNFHVAIANHVLEHEGMDRVQLILSPQSPFKSDTVCFRHRFEMCDAAIQKYDNMKVSTIERDMPMPSYTIDTLRLLQNTHISSSEFSIIMGLDNWLQIHKWKDYASIVIEYPILVIPRFGGNADDNEESFYSQLVQLGCRAAIHSDTRMIKDMPLSNISSTFIREEIKNGKNVLPYIGYDVNAIINRNNLYR